MLRSLNLTSKLRLNISAKKHLRFFNIKTSSNVNVKQYSKLSSLDISGILPPIVTPFDNNYNIYYDKLALNLEIWKKIPFKGYIVLGSNGEFPLLSENEKINFVKYVKNNSNKIVIAGTGCQSTKETIELTNKMADVGADAALIISPFFYKGRMTDDLLYDYYITVAEASKIPIILYNVPVYAGIDFTCTLVAKLADHPNIIGLKDSGGDITKIGLIVHKTKDKNFQILAGSAGFLYASLCVGCVGGIPALGNVLGEENCELYDNFKAGKHNKALEMQYKLIEPNLAVTKLFGVAGLKTILELKGYYGGPCRPPLKPLQEEEVSKLKEAFQRNGFL